MEKFNLTTLMKRLTALAMVAVMFVVTGCGDDDDGGEPAPTLNLYETMSAESDLTQIKAYVDADADLKAMLEGSTEYTFFAPNDAAFAKLETLLGTSLETVAPQIVSQVLMFHFAQGAKTQAELTGSSVVTEQGESVVVDANGNITTGGSDDEVLITKGDIRATNGIMHKVETILIPPTIYASIGVNLGKLSQAVLLSANFTTLASAVAKADTYAADNSLPTITSYLTGDTEYTLFAPTNQTFEAINSDPAVVLAAYTAQQWYGILSNHFVADDGNGADDNVTVDEAELTTGATFTTKAGATLQIFNNTAAIPADNGVGIYIDSNGDVDLGDSGTYTNFDAEVALLDAFEGANGKLHVIAGVLAPPM